MGSRAMRIATTALAALALVLGGLLYCKSAECRYQASRIDTLYSQARWWQQEATGSRHQVDSLRTQLSGLAPSPIHDLYIRALRTQGLKNPVGDLISDLQRHPEVIPYRGTLGGRMAFNDPNRIRVLSGRWVYAPFEDGHIAGEAILEYRVGSRGSISWRVLESRLL